MKKFPKIFFVIVIYVCLLDGFFTALLAAAEPPATRWSRTFSGTSALIGAITTDSNDNVLVGAQGSISHIFNSKSFLSKFDTAGNQLWEVEFLAQFINGLVTDEEGNTYTSGNFHVGPWMAKISPDGAELWNRVSVIPEFTSTAGLVLDSEGSFYTTGTVLERSGSEIIDRNAVLRKVSPEGISVWFNEFGTEADDQGIAIGIDSSDNLYVAANTSPTYSESGEELTAGSVILRKFDSSGSQIWTRTIAGSEEVDARGVAVDPDGNIFLGGSTLGQLGNENFGDYDAFISRWDTNGNLLWTEQFGTGDKDFISSLLIGEDDVLYVSGIEGSQSIISQGQGFLRQIDYSGNVIWSRAQQIDGNLHDIREIALDTSQNIYIAEAIGIIPSEGLLTKLVPVPEPSSLAITYIVIIMYSNRRVLS